LLGKFSLEIHRYTCVPGVYTGTCKTQKAFRGFLRFCAFRLSRCVFLICFGTLQYFSL